MKYAADEYPERGHPGKEMGYRGVAHIRPIRDGVARIEPLPESRCPPRRFAGPANVPATTWFTS